MPPIQESPEDDFLLLNPGPVPISDAVREAMAEPMVSHRSAEFEDVYERIREGFQHILENSRISRPLEPPSGETLVLNGTATMGMEAAIANLASADGEIVVASNGKFGDRFADIAHRYGEVRTVQAEWGQSLDIDAVVDAIRPDTDVVAMVHNETSTGILNPLHTVGKAAREHDAYFVVDGVTSVGGDIFKTVEWNVDVVVTDAHKALAAPPGISLLYATDRAIDGFDGPSAPYYEDLEWYVEKAAANQTPFTSAVPLFRALAAAIDEVLAEEVPERVARHRQFARAFRVSFEEMGLSLFAEPASSLHYSNTVTAVRLPDPIREDPEPFFDAVKDRNVGISGGQAHLAGEIFRVSNMGDLSKRDVERGVRVVGESLAEAGFEADTQAGLRKVQRLLNLVDLEKLRARSRGNGRDDEDDEEEAEADAAETAEAEGEAGGTVDVDEPGK